MRKLLIPALIFASAGGATPAAAQYGGGNGQGSDIRRELGQIERQIDNLHQRRLISRSEAQRLSRRADDIARLHERYRRDGLSGREHRELQERVRDLRERLRDERREGRDDRRGDRRDYRR